MTISIMSEEGKKKNYLLEVKDELKKVSWTTKEELIVCSKIVLGATFIFGLGIYLIDITIRGSLWMVHFLANLIIG